MLKHDKAKQKSLMLEEHFMHEVRIIKKKEVRIIKKTSALSEQRTMEEQKKKKRKISKKEWRAMSLEEQRKLLPEKLNKLGEWFFDPKRIEEGDYLIIKDMRAVLR